MLVTGWDGPGKRTEDPRERADRKKPPLSRRTPVHSADRGSSIDHHCSFGRHLGAGGKAVVVDFFFS